VRILEGDFTLAPFVSRPNRFVVECLLDDSPITAYLPNPGRLWELLVPGRMLYLTENGPEQRLRYTVIAVQKEGRPILLHTHLTNTVVEMLLRQKAIPGFEGFEIIRREVTSGHSRYDFLLAGGGGTMVLEAKNCTLFRDGLAMFPDAVTERGSRHLRGLYELAEKGQPAGVLFVVQWPHVRYFMPEYHTDLEFSRSLLLVRESITVKAISIEWNQDLSFNPEVTELTIPWDVVERNVKDRGSYIVVLRLDSDRQVEVGELGVISLKGGYYLYVGSAKQGLTKRIARHGRKKKRLFWHIDYLAKEASFYKALPIRTSIDIECEIAERLKGIAEWSVADFGCSDCSCESHLFGMEADPVTSPAFIEMLLDFRIGMLIKELR
jgi:sugar fermentation stimulation protein A